MRVSLPRAEPHYMPAGRALHLPPGGHIDTEVVMTVLGSAADIAAFAADG